MLINMLQRKTMAALIVLLSLQASAQQDVLASVTVCGWLTLLP